MRKIFTKIICFAVAAVAAVGILLVSACSNTYKSQSLGSEGLTGEVSSNGGFAVEKGNYVYFINGKQANTADNTYGEVVKGAIMRISKTSLKNRDYSDVQTVVPQIAYSGNSNAGIFIYGEYIYYATPSTDKNSDGEVQNTYLAFKSTKLDGTEAMKDYYVQYSNNSIEYRYVEEDGVVYLIYVATSETLYDESTGVTNIHSFNTKTGVDTLLAYNVENVTFDKNDVTNPRIFYTMKVPNFLSGKTATFSNYNQVYTVTASATTPKDYSKYIEENVKDYDEKEDGPLYVNCGMLVFDGIGKVDGMKQNVTDFNGAGAEDVERPAYTYTISSYQSGNLFYTRSSSFLDSLLFNVKESEITGNGWNPVTGNPENEKALLDDSSAASTYTYLFDKDGNIENVIIADSKGFIKTVVTDDGKLQTKVDFVDTFYMTSNSSQPTVLFLDNTNNYIYYSITGGNGYTVNRIKYDGGYDEYNTYPTGDDVNGYTAVRILDLDADAGWYKPEMFDNQLLFATQTKNMTDYVYIMACDLNGSDGKILDNKEIDALNKKYEAVAETIDKVDSSVYENLQNALWYGFYTSDSEYIDTLRQAYVDIMEYDIERFWSNESVAKFKDFVEAKGDWSSYASDTVKVNGKDVAANKLDYYYAILGVMNEEDAEALSEDLRTTYLKEYPEKEQTWFEGLSTGAKAGFIIGVCAGGLIVIGAAVVVTLVIIRKRKEKLPTYTKKRIKVDTTDDKNIDVYSDEQ